MFRYEQGERVYTLRHGPGQVIAGSAETLPPSYAVECYGGKAVIVYRENELAEAAKAAADFRETMRAIPAEVLAQTITADTDVELRGDETHEELMEVVEEANHIGLGVSIGYLSLIYPRKE